MDKLITLFHGSEKIFEVPGFGKGKKSKDFGLGLQNNIEFREV